MTSLREVMYTNENIEFFNNAKDKFNFGINEQILIDKLLDMDFLAYLGLINLVQIIDPEDIVENVKRHSELYVAIQIFAAYGVTKLLEKMVEGASNAEGS